MIFICTSTGKMIRTRDLRIDEVRVIKRIKTCRNLTGKIPERDAQFIRARRNAINYRSKVKRGIIKKYVDPLEQKVQRK